MCEILNIFPFALRINCHHTISFLQQFCPSFPPLMHSFVLWWFYSDIFWLISHSLCMCYIYFLCGSTWDDIEQARAITSKDSKEMKRVNPKGNQLWVFIGRANTEAGAPIFWPPDAKRQLIGKEPDAGKDWGHEEKGAAQYKMIR